VDDDDPAISYKLLDRGTAVHTSDGDVLGTVDQVLDNVREDIFDGIVVRTSSGERFVDAPEVARITDQRVTLSIDAAAAAQLPAYEPGAPQYEANTRAGRLARLLGRGGWKRR
jgi:sporulation protein YlmC with PRC-barrel domain